VTGGRDGGPRRPDVLPGVDPTPGPPPASLRAGASRQGAALASVLGGFAAFYAGLPEGRRADFLFGNPQEPAPLRYVEAIRTAALPEDPERYAYTQSLPEAVRAVAAGLRERFGVAFEPEDVAMTNGNFAGLSVVLRAIADPGDAVVYVSPPWFFYEPLIVAAGMRPVRVVAPPPSFDLDVDAVAAAVGPEVRAVIVNSPHNPTGRIYPAGALDDLAAALEEASARQDRPVYLISDEAYDRIVFDGQAFPTPVARYPFSFLLYTYAKTLLSPGTRLGYVAMPPTMPGREGLREALLLAQIATGWAYPSSIFQHAVPELERMDAGIERLQARRDLVCGALRDQGYELLVPEGTFYVMVRSPDPDDRAFCEGLAREDVWVLPGSMFEAPGWFRISLTGNDDMVAYALPRFEAAIRGLRAGR
jgi:aspartate aminotransferase